VRQIEESTWNHEDNESRESDEVNTRALLATQYRRRIFTTKYKKSRKKADEASQAASDPGFLMPRENSLTL
jgi:hypothetical protein